MYKQTIKETYKLINKGVCFDMKSILYLYFSKFKSLQNRYRKRYLEHWEINYVSLWDFNALVISIDCHSIDCQTINYIYKNTDFY